MVETTLIVEGGMMMPVCVLGMALNITSIFYFSRLRHQRAFHRLLLVLAVVDTLHLVCSAATFSLPQLSETFDELYWPHIVPYTLPLAQTSMTASVYLTISITMERYFSIVCPFSHYRSRWMRSSFFLAAPGLVFSLGFTLPNYFVLSTKAVSDTQTEIVDRNHENITFQTSEQATVSLDTLVSRLEGQGQGAKFYNFTDTSTGSLTLLERLDNGSLALHTTDSRAEIQFASFRDDPVFIQVYVMWMHLVFNTVLPMVVLLVFNTKIYRKLATVQRDSSPQLRDPRLLRRSGDSRLRARERRLARTGLTIVGIFIICHTLKTVPSVFEIFGQDPRAVAGCSLLLLLGHLLLAINSSVNFLVYFLASGRKMTSLLTCTRLQPRTSPPSTRDPETTEVVFFSRGCSRISQRKETTFSVQTSTTHIIPRDETV